MLIIRNQKHFDAVVAFAKEHGFYESDPAKPEVRTLQTALSQLERFIRKDASGETTVRVVLSPDFAPQSFVFSVQRKTNEDWCEVLGGGLLFHGPHDGGGQGGAPTFAVSLSPGLGWSIHT